MKTYLSKEEEAILNQIINIIKEKNRFMLFTHEAADGDAISSVIALSLFLKKLQKDFYAFIPGKIQENYFFLKGIKEVNKISEGDLKSIISTYTDYIGISLDSADSERLGEYEDLFLSLKTKIVIDHHSTNTFFGSINFIPFGKSSNAELVYVLLEKIDKSLIDFDIANALYLGIMTDTGSFHYSNTTSDSLIIASELLKLGASPPYVSQNTYESKSLAALKLLGKALDNMEILFNGRVIFSVITKEMFKESEAAEEDSEGIVDQLRKVKGSEIVILMKEIEDGLVRVSLRGKNSYVVRDVAVKFGGGGHMAAAGCTINMPLNQSKEMLLEEVKKLLLSKTVE